MNGKKFEPLNGIRIEDTELKCFSPVIVRYYIEVIFCTLKVKKVGPCAG
jgi:hypothetical protein